MSSFVIEGGKSLAGQIEPQGSKNEVLQILCATLLTSEKVRINNVPDILDVNMLIDILKILGVKVTHPKRGTFIFQADELDISILNSEAFKSHASKLRGSIMLAGSLLARFGESIIPRPGGDRIGRRRLDTHLWGISQLGVTFDYDKESRIYRLQGKVLKGNSILLDEASVTGTANMILLAVLTEGKTTIYNAACEPYIQQLCKMLNNMGANISGIASNLLTIEGVESLSGTEHTVLPDMIEVGSWIGMAALTQSEITIKNVSWDNLGIIPLIFKRLGIQLQKINDDIYIPAHVDGYKVEGFIDGSILSISDAPWPGFTPDLLSIIIVTAIQARGSVLIHQKMFESRLFFVDNLIEMGGKIILCDPHRATVIGNDFRYKLVGTRMSSPDIRAGISLLIAALSAKGTSTIYNIEQIDRGYERIVERLLELGARIERKSS